MKKIKLLIIPVLASAATLATGLTTAVSCSQGNNNKIVIDKNEIEQKAMSSGLAIYSFDFKGNTLPDSRRFVNIQLTEISIKSDSEVKSVSVLNIIGKDDIVIHDDGHFDVPVTFIDPYQFSGNTTVKFQLKFRYRLSGTNVEEIVENLVIKYFNSIPAPSDTALFKLNGKTTYSDIDDGLFIYVPVKLIKDRDGYPYEATQFTFVACSDDHIMSDSLPVDILPDTFSLKLVCNYSPVFDQTFNFDLFFKYKGADGVEKSTTLKDISFDFHAAVVTKGELFLTSSAETVQVNQTFDISFKYVDPLITTRTIRPVSNALLFDPVTGKYFDGIIWQAPTSIRIKQSDKTYPFDIHVSIVNPTQPLSGVFGLCITIESTKHISDQNFTFTYTPEQP